MKKTCRRLTQARWFEPYLFGVSFVVPGTFVAMNPCIAVILNNLEESKAAQLAALVRPVTHDEILSGLRSTRASLMRLDEKLGQLPPSGDTSR